MDKQQQADPLYSDPKVAALHKALFQGEVDADRRLFWLIVVLVFCPCRFNAFCVARKKKTRHILEDPTLNVNGTRSGMTLERIFCLFLPAKSLF